MKKVLLLAMLLLFLGCEKIDVYKTSRDAKPIPFKPGAVQCVECTMPLTTKLHTAQAIMPNKRVYFFDDPGCLAKWYIKQKNKNSIKLWIYTDDTHRYIDAKKAWYKLGDKTPMGYGFGAYEKKPKDAVDFNTFVVMVQRGETLQNPAVRKRVLKE